MDPLYSCRKCRNPVALAQDLVSKSFVAKSGEALMYSQATKMVLNIVLGKSYDKQMLTGNYTIANVYCNACGEELGWKCIKVHEKTDQTYKVGSLIIEKDKVVDEYRSKTNSHPLYSCRKCRTPLALAEDLLSKSFVAKSGKAFMFSQAMNTVLGKSYDKQMLTGNFTIADVYCNTCGEELGWKYIKAHEEAQTCKVGTFIIEKAKIVEEYRSNPLYSCGKCRTPLALAEDLLSKSFVAKSGKAFMFSQAMNIVLGKSYDKQMLTGNFTIADVYCNTCGQELGWKYIKAHEETQTWKVGTFIIEKAKIVGEYRSKPLSAL